MALPHSNLSSQFSTGLKTTSTTTTWAVGPSGFGYGDGDDATVVPTTTSIYLRHEFTLDNLAAIEEAVFAMDYDDGYVAYLNGVEIGRGNCGNPGEFVAWDATLSVDQEAVLYNGGTPDLINLNPATALVQGMNTLAIEVHNVGPGSSDLTARPFLFLGTSEQAQTFGTPPGWFSPAFSDTHFVTFNLNMSNENVSPEGVYLAGGSFGYPGAHAFADPDGDDVWTLVMEIPHGFTGHYTFTNGACQDWSCKEYIGGQDCADPSHWNDRLLENVTSSFTISTCFSQCTTDGTCAAISGCTDPAAINHFDAATEDDGSCIYMNESNLPLVQITTDTPILDDPRIVANMKVTNLAGRPQHPRRRAQRIQRPNHHRNSGVVLPVLPQAVLRLGNPGFHRGQQQRVADGHAGGERLDPPRPVLRQDAHSQRRHLQDGHGSSANTPAAGIANCTSTATTAGCTCSWRTSSATTTGWTSPRCCRQTRRATN